MVVKGLRNGGSFSSFAIINIIWKKEQHSFPKRGWEGRVKGRLEFSRKFIQIWEVGRP